MRLARSTSTALVLSVADQAVARWCADRVAALVVTVVSVAAAGEQGASSGPLKRASHAKAQAKKTIGSVADATGLATSNQRSRIRAVGAVGQVVSRRRATSAT